MERFGTYLLTLSLFILGCADQAISAKSHISEQSLDAGLIVGGELLDYNSSTASRIVFISSENSQGYNQICTGSFISDKIILTARHCISKNKGSMSANFRPRDYNIEENKTDVIDLPIESVFTIKANSDLNVETQDLGIIVFSGGLPAGARITKLATQLQNVDTTKMIAVGYGKDTGLKEIDIMADTGEGHLRSKKMRSSAMESVTDIFKLNQKINNGGVCDGDSGSPALVRNKVTREVEILGVASHLDFTQNLDEEDECKNESVYMNMLFYAKHIDACIKTIDSLNFENSDGKALSLTINKAAECSLEI